MRLLTCLGLVAVSSCTAAEPNVSVTEQPSYVLGNYLSTVQALNPVGYWRLGDTSGSTAIDSSSNPMNGTYSGAYWLGQPGAVRTDPNTAASFAMGNAVIPDRDAYSLTKDWDFYSGLTSESSSTTWGTAQNSKSWICDAKCDGNYYVRDGEYDYVDPYGIVLHTFPTGRIVPAATGATYQQGRPDSLLNGETQIMASWSSHASGGPLSPVALVARYSDANNVINFVSAELVEDPITLALTLRLVQTTNNASQTLTSTNIGYSDPVGAAWWLVRFRFDGTTLQARAWASINTEPPAWQVQATVTGTPTSGRVAVRYSNASGTARPSVTFKNFWVQTLGFTYSMFIYVASNQPQAKVFPFGKAKHESQLDHDNDEYYFRYERDTRTFKSYVFNLDGGYGAGQSAAGIDENKWHHVVTTLDNGDWRDPTAGVRMWWDGRAVPPVEHPASKYGDFDHCVDECIDYHCNNGNDLCWRITPLNGTEALKIGTTAILTQGTFNGAIDEVALFDRKLSESQIQDLYNSSCQPANGKLSWPYANITATATSAELPQFAAGYAVDGSPYTRWSSVYSDNQSITVDLGGTHNIEKVHIVWEFAYASTYDVLVSTNGIVFTWVKRVTKTSPSEDWVTLYRTARYVRMQGITRGTQYGYSIYEFEFYPCDRVPLI